MARESLDTDDCWLVWVCLHGGGVGEDVGSAEKRFARGANTHISKSRCGALGEYVFPFFWRGGVCVFCGGFREKRGAERGFLMVKPWWNAGKRWSENDLKSAAKNTPLF